MRPEIFEPSTASLILSWYLCVLAIILGVGWLIGLLVGGSSSLKHSSGVPWILSAWLGVCIILLSPIRYLLFQILLILGLLSQGFWPLKSIISIGVFLIFAPFIFGILYLVTIGLPLFLVALIFDGHERTSFVRGLAAGVIMPVACVLGSFLFFNVLPIAGRTVGWLSSVSVRDLMQATKGAPALIHKHIDLVSPNMLPAFYEDTPQEEIDLLRCHVVYVYADRRRHAFFLKHQYPEIYEKYTSEP